MTHYTTPPTPTPETYVMPDGIPNSNPELMGINPFTGYVATTNPAVYFAAKHWKILTIGALVVVIGLMGYGGYRYQQHMTTKLATIASQMKEYKNENDNLKTNLVNIRADITAAKNRANQFDNDIAAIRKENALLRSKIGNLGKLSNTPGTTTEQAQQSINDIRNDINAKWGKIGTGGNNVKK